MLWRGACVAVPMFFGKSEDEVGVRDVADIMHRMLIMRPPWKLSFQLPRRISKMIFDIKLKLILEILLRGMFQKLWIPA